MALKPAASNTIFIIAFASLAFPYLVHAQRFLDVSQEVGFERPFGPRIKYGGAAVADLDADGYPDFLFGHHDHNSLDLYFNNRDGTFERSSFQMWRDTHGLTPFRMSPRKRYMHFALSRGGQNGQSPNGPLIFSVRHNRSVEDITEHSGLLPMALGRGRTAVFMNLRKWRHTRPDVIFMNAALPNFTNQHHRAFEVLPREKFRPRVLQGGFASIRNAYGTVTDVDDDMRVELVSFQHLKVHAVSGGFRLRDVSSSVLPAGLDFRGVVAVAELDYDNDGRWDLYVARTTTGDLKWLQGRSHDDYLLRNVGGHYEDASRTAGIPLGTQTRGVTVGDFNNDGHIDILLVLYDKPDILLRNNGDGTFASRNARLMRAPTVRGDMATAVDYDRDGKLDVVLSEGDWFKKSAAGFYRLMKNIGAFQNYLLVRVKSSPTGKATSLHAVVKVHAEGLSMMRRVGSPGTAVSISYVELLHFGLGNVETVSNVTVQWTDLHVEALSDVGANDILTFGI